MLLHDILTRNAAKAPGDVALVGEDGSRQTWRELLESVRTLADVLSSSGVKRGDRVAILSMNGPEYFQVFLAASWVGAVLAPVNYRFSSVELADVIADSDPQVILVEDRFVDVAVQVRAAGCAPAAAWLEFGDGPGRLPKLADAVAAADLLPACPDLDADETVLICYTGGSTGRAKGVMLSHRAILANATNWIVHDEIRPDDVYLAAGALFHIGIAAPFAYWQVGARVVVMNYDAGRALDLMEQEGITAMVASGTIFKMLIDEMTVRPRTGLRLRRIDSGAAPVPLGLVRRAESVLACEVGQIYGQTEVCLTATYLYPRDYAVGSAPGASEVEKRRLDSVGRAAALSVVGIVDTVATDLQFLAAGEVGEIAVSGENIMSGYWRRPDTTAEVLVDGWVRSGDLGFLDEDGYLTIVGRKKEMIITGGENVYAKEVELVLVEHPEIEEAVVIGVPDDHWGERVQAVCLATPGSHPSEDEVRAFCRERLAGYKVPKHVEFREELPRLPSHKVARAALRAEFSLEVARHPDATTSAEGSLDLGPNRGDQPCRS